MNTMDEVAGGYTRKNAFLHGTFAMTDKVELFVQGMYSDDSANVRWQSAALAGLMGGARRPGQPIPGAGHRHANPERARHRLSEHHRTAIGREQLGPGYRFVYPGHDALATQYFTYKCLPQQPARQPAR